MSKYEERDIDLLDEYGNFYTDHVIAMTAEGLRSKSDIAAELGWRDREIARLTLLNQGRNIDGTLIPAKPFAQPN